MNLDLLRHPFSCAGSYLVISHLVPWDLGDHRWDELRQEDGLYLRHVHGSGRKVVARLELTQDRVPQPASFFADAEILRMKADGITATAQFASPTRLVFRGEGGGFRIRVVEVGLFGFACPQTSDRWLLNHFISGRQFHLHLRSGRLGLHAPWDGWKCSEIEFDLEPGGSGGVWELEMEEVIEQPKWAVDQTRRRRLPGFGDWLEAAPQLPEKWSEAREHALWVQWVSIAGPHHLQFRPGLLMSKNWMPQIWSWDHCFNAMALSAHQPELAWDNLLVVFDHQTSEGKLPDTVTDEAIGWNFTKVPIHGWAFRWMKARCRWIGRSHAAELYPKLAGWTRWWFDHRVDGEDGIPHYNHGNDGWDNGTPFKIGMPVQSPELCAYLILQMDVLADLAGSLGLGDEAAEWSRRSDEFLKSCLQHAWDGRRFRARQARTGFEHASDSLLNFMPIVLGRRLPEEVRARLVEGLSEPRRFLTEWGLATESVSSPEFEADGYWRGPIWAPCILLIVTGLIDAGEQALARDIASRFCRMFLKAGAAENYHPLTGEALRDPCYSWSASVFLILAREYADS